MSSRKTKIELLVKSLALVKIPFGIKHWKWLRFFILGSLDLLTVAFCYWLSFVLRLDSFRLDAFGAALMQTLPIYMVCHLVVYVGLGMYRQVWRYATIMSAVLVLRSVVSATALATLIVYTTPFVTQPPPRSVAIIFALLCSIFTICIRFSWRIWVNLQGSQVDDVKERCLIYGAGSAGSMLARHIASTPDFPYTAEGFIDDDKNKSGRLLHNLNIYGPGRDLASIAQKQGISTIIIALHAASGKVVRDIVSMCQDAGLKPLILPDIASSLGAEPIQPRAVNVRDLLRRSPKVTDQKLVSAFFNDKVILITGAGGSIGSEICRQIAELRPRKVVLLDASEFNLYKISTELRDRYNNSFALVAVLGSIIDEALIEKTFSDHHPSAVLHAAAYKHVSLVEENPLQAIINNVLGTKILLDCAVRSGASEFLLISSDKAVRPTSVMGATKRCCELLLQARHQTADNNCRISSVRFGNVLGSSGSVVPRFLEQIQRGGPVTVTHPEITRYFMLTSEAVGLVLQSIAMAKGGEIFVLNMGEPVKIAEMARLLIKLAGKTQGRDVDIVFTGLQKGEKLYEELILEGSEMNTLHDDVFITTSHKISCVQIQRRISLLLDAARSGQEEVCLKMLRELCSDVKAADSQSGFDGVGDFKLVYQA